MTGRTAIALLMLWGTACGDDLTSRRLDGVADGAAGSNPDASRDDADADAATADGAPEHSLVVFDNPGDTFAWDCGWIEPDVGDYALPTYLDLTRAAGTQPDDGNPSSIYCYVIAPRGNFTPGGLWFRSWRDLDAPGAGAFYAAGDPFVLEGPDVDINVIPPLMKAVGDTVGPGDEWVSGELPGVQTGHLRDYTRETAPDQVWFTAGVVGVRFTLADGVHYAFVELESVPNDYEWSWRWRPLRWGYQPEPDQPLTIPP